MLRCSTISCRGAHSLKWTTPPTTILLAKKADDPKTTAAAKRIVRHLLSEYEGLSIVVEKDVYNDLQAALDPDDSSLLQQLVVLGEGEPRRRCNRGLPPPAIVVNLIPTSACGRLVPADKSDLVSKVDLVVTLGGDGTVLHVASLFANGAVPPILGVSMGTLGFLMPFSEDAMSALVCLYEDADAGAYSADLKQFKGAFREVMHSEASLLLRMRLQCAIHDASGGLVTWNHDAGTPNMRADDATKVHLTLRLSS